MPKSFNKENKAKLAMGKLVTLWSHWRPMQIPFEHRIASRAAIAKTESQVFLRAFGPMGA